MNSVESRVENSMMIMVLMFAEIESLRSRI